MVKYFLTLIILAVTFGGNAQIKFFERYDGLGIDLGEGIAQLSDSSYIVCGSSTSFAQGESQSFLMKIDTAGQHIWSKNYGGSEAESAKRIFVTENEGYYVAGHSNSTTAGDFDFHFFHTDLNGELLWEKKYGTDSWDILNDAVKLADSSYILVGETFNSVDGEKDGYIVRLDKFGDTLWTKSTGFLGEDVFNGVMNFYDTAFVVGGKVWNADSSFSKAYLACMKIDGSLVWDKQFGDTGNYEIRDLGTYQGDIQAVGNRISDVDNLRDEYRLRTDSVGNVIYTFVPAALGDRSYEEIAKYGPFNRFYIGLTNDDQFTTGVGMDTYVGDFNENLNSFNTGVDVDAPYDDIPTQIVATNDGGAIVVGYCNSVIYQVPSVYVLKIGPTQDYPITYPWNDVINLLSIPKNELTKSNSEVYPNPAITELTIKIHQDNVEGEILIVNLFGQMCKSEKVNGESTSINVNSLKSGVYFVQLKEVNGRKTTLKKITIL